MQPIILWETTFGPTSQTRNKYNMAFYKMTMYETVSLDNAIQYRHDLTRYRKKILVNTNQIQFLSYNNNTS